MADEREPGGAAGAAAEAEPRTSHPRRLALALIGELHRAGDSGPYRAVDLIDVLEGAGVSAPAARAALDRFVLRGLLSRERAGRGVGYCLTPTGEQVIAEGGDRVHAAAPFAPVGEGWTLVTFSVPEGKRGLRHQLRSALTWAGFAPLRDGVWVAPGERDPVQALESLGPDLGTADIVAFRARDLAGFPMGDRVGDAWDLEAIRGEHERFLERWTEPGAALRSTAPLAALTLLVADWLELLRRDPSLPVEYLGEDWPAPRSFAVYTERRAELERRRAEEAEEGAAALSA